MNILSPKKLRTQLIIFITLAIIGVQLASLSFFLSETDFHKKRLERDVYLQATANTVNLLSFVPKKHHQEIIKTLSNYRVFYSIDNDSDIEKIKNNKDKSIILEQILNSSHEEYRVKKYSPIAFPIFQLLKNIYSSYISGVRIEVDNKSSLRLTTSVKLDNNYWLNLNVYEGTPFPQWAERSILTLLIASLVIIFIIILLLNQIIKPLNELAKRARKIGTGQSIKQIKAVGPSEIQDTIAAFNSMQQRIEKLIVHKTRSLAAISHDIRTPLTSLRLQSEFIEEEELREKICLKIEELEAITSATMSFAKHDSWSEESRHIELSSLIETLSDDLVDIGLNVTCQLPNKCSYICRPISLKRALSNIIENGVKYGHEVSIALEQNEESIIITISDKGKGIPVEHHERLFHPFERMENSRNREHGGSGLGLAIALTIVQSHGGDISLINRINPKNQSISGLDVVISLPKK